MINRPEFDRRKPFRINRRVAIKAAACIDRLKSQCEGRTNIAVGSLEVLGTVALINKAARELDCTKAAEFAKILELSRLNRQFALVLLDSGKALLSLA